METKNREYFKLIHVSLKTLAQLSTLQGMWSETPEEVAAGIEWGRRKRVLLRWVRKQLGARLTLRERRCLELYYFQGLTFSQVGERTGTDPSSSFRAVKRAVIKLKRAAEEDPAWRANTDTGKVANRE